MPEHRYDFGMALAIAAEAIGKPGERTFRLLVHGDDRKAALWLEKEQLQALAMAADELLAQTPSARNADQEIAEEADPASDFPGEASVEFKIGQLGIGYDEEGALFVLLAHDIEGEANAPATFRCLISRSQLAGLGRQAHNLIVAGRPRCPLCGSPLEPSPHLCPPSNGHGSVSEITQ